MLAICRWDSAPYLHRGDTSKSARGLSDLMHVNNAENKLPSTSVDVTAARITSQSSQRPLLCLETGSSLSIATGTYQGAVADV